MAGLFHTHLSPGLHMAVQVILLVHGLYGNGDAEVEWGNGGIVCISSSACLSLLEVFIELQAETVICS